MLKPLIQKTHPDRPPNKNLIPFGTFPSFCDILQKFN